jgi:hypothetical protein
MNNENLLMKSTPDGKPVNWRPKGDEFTLQVIDRVVKLYETMTIAEVHQQIKREFPGKKYSLDRIRRLIRLKKRELSDQAFDCMIDGCEKQVEAIRNRIRMNLMDKRSRLTLGLQKLVDDSLDDMMRDL